MPDDFGSGHMKPWVANKQIQATSEDKYEKEDEDGDQSQEGCFEVQGGPADDVEGDKVS